MLPFQAQVCTLMVHGPLGHRKVGGGNARQASWTLKNPGLGARTLGSPLQAVAASSLSLWLLVTGPEKITET